MKKAILFSLLIILFTPLHSQNISISPGENGQLYPQLHLDWSYGESPFGSIINLHSLGSSETDNTPYNAELDKSITTVEEHYSGEIIPINYSFNWGNFTARPGLGIQGDVINNLQVGYADIGLEGSEYRMFYNNDRQILSLRPGLHISTSLTQSNFTLSLNGFYSPVIYIKLEQTLSSAAIGTTALDTPETTLDFSGYGSNAWGVNAALKWNNNILPILLTTSWQSYSIEYEYIMPGSNIIKENISNLDGDLSVFLSIKMIEIKGSNPMVGVGTNWEWSTNLSTNDVSQKDYPLRLFYGISL